MPTVLQAMNGIFEILVYNSVLSGEEINRIEQYLEQKWPITYPAQDFRTYSNVMRIPHLCLWLNPTNRSNFTFTDPERTKINFFYSSENLLNSFKIDNNSGTEPIYNSNAKRIQFSVGISPLFLNGPRLINDTRDTYINMSPLFTGAGNIYGLTIFTLLSTNPLQTSSSIATILAAFAPQDPDNLLSSSYPTILQDDFGRIFIGAGISDTSAISQGFNIGANLATASPYTNDSFLLTTQFTETDVHMWVNGYSLDISGAPRITNNIRSYLENSSLGCYIGGVPAVPTPGNGYITCSTEIGEILIYKNALSTNERDIVSRHIYSNYNISSNISSNGLVGWWDANDITHNNSGSNIVRNWNGKYNNNTLSNSTSDAIPFLRRYVNPETNTNYNFVDLNNGNPSAMTCLLSNITGTTCNLSVFMVTTGSYSSNGSVLEIPSASMDISCNYDGGLQRERFELDNSSTTLTSGNQFYISTYSIINSNTANIYSIPASKINTLTTDPYIAGNLNNTNIIVGENFRNSISELIIYNRALSNSEYTNILAYLQSKWTFPQLVNGLPNSISGLILWYDANNIVEGTTTWSSQSGYGPNLEINPLSASGLQITTLNNNIFLNMAGAGMFPVSSDISNNTSINENYTFFIVSKPGTVDGTIVSLSPIVDRSFNYPGLYLSNDRYMIVSGNDFPFTNSDKCYSRFIDPTYPTVDLTGINITCINHSFNSSTSKGSYTIRSKGTFYEQSYSNLDESPFEDSNVQLLIGGSTPDDNLYNGLIGEFLFYNRSLNDVNVADVFKYLEGKWLNSGGPNNPCF
jgi:hypothetical protein